MSNTSADIGSMNNLKEEDNEHESFDDESNQGVSKKEQERIQKELK